MSVRDAAAPPRVGPLSLRDGCVTWAPVEAPFAPVTHYVVRHWAPDAPEQVETVSVAPEACVAPPLPGRVVCVAAHNSSGEGPLSDPIQ